MRLSRSSLLDRLLPPPEPKRVAFLSRSPFAHRGLHGGGIAGARVIENSRAAFKAAIASGHGIELDVRINDDGCVYVFHDETLDRLTDGSGAFASLSTANLDALRLKGTSETIPQLSEILALVAGRVPLLIEIKAPGALVGVLCLAVRRALEGYRGDYAIMSFNPLVGRWFHTHAPRIVRGLVISEEDQKGYKGYVQRLVSLWRARPDFLAYDIRSLPSRFAAAQRSRGLPVVTWTVRTAKQERTAMKHADEVIYEQPNAKAR
jgi:glycerophosphoryl diester phosphodiesterase